jgi:Fe-Mn family superoxide dismutase
MKHSMPQLPYPFDSLEPILSRETIEFHYGRHLQTYLSNLNRLLPETPFEQKTLVETVQQAPEGTLLNNAGQVLNHTLYFTQFTPLQKNKEPHGQLGEMIRNDFGSFERMQQEMEEASARLFGSGWVWLSLHANGHLHIQQEANGGNPVRNGLQPLLGFDVWEHAYYIDYRNNRSEHIHRLWDLIDWKVVEGRI